jgi:hypothetical protein
MDELAAAHVTTTLAAGGSVSGTKEELVMESELPSAQARSEEAMKGAVQ